MSGQCQRWILSSIYQASLQLPRPPVSSQDQDTAARHNNPLFYLCEWLETKSRPGWCPVSSPLVTAGDPSSCAAQWEPVSRQQQQLPPSTSRLLTTWEHETQRVVSWRVRASYWPAPHMLGWKHEISGSDKRTYSVDTDECKEYSAVCVSGWQCLDNAVFNLYLLVEETIIIKWKMKTRVIMIVTTE